MLPNAQDVQFIDLRSLTYLNERNERVKTKNKDKAMLPNA